MAVERDTKGRVLPGSVLNPQGGSKKRKDYQALLRAACTPAKWKRICNKAIAEAVEGDRYARKWVAEYLLGKPVQRLKAEVKTRSEIGDSYTAILDRIYGVGTDSPGTEVSEESD